MLNFFTFSVTSVVQQTAPKKNKRILLQIVFDVKEMFRFLLISEIFAIKIYVGYSKFTSLSFGYSKTQRGKCKRATTDSSGAHK